MGDSGVSRRAGNLIRPSDQERDDRTSRREAPVNRLQRIALFNLALAAAGLFLQLIRLAAGAPPIKLLASTLTLILCGFLLASYLHRRRLSKLGGSHYDERDLSLHKSAAFAGLIAGFGVFFVATLIAFLAVGPGGSMQIGSLLGVFMLSTMTYFTAESLAIVVQYRRGGPDGQD